MQNSIIQKSQLEGAMRLDAEYYQPEYLEISKKIKLLNHSTLGEIISILTDYHANGSYEILRNNVSLLNYSEYALMIRAVDLQNNNYIDDVKYVNRKAYEFLEKTKIFGKEIIIDKIGNAGEVYLMPKLNRPVTLGMNLFLLRLRNNFSPEYLYSFLTCRYGQQMINQKITGTAPLSIDKNSVRSIIVPIPNKVIELRVKDLVNNSIQQNNDSIFFYSQAENLLLKELGFEDFNLDEELWSIVNFSDVRSAHRIDPEYFQPMYEQLMQKLKVQNSKTLYQLIVAHTTGYPFSSSNYVEQGVPLIRINNIRKGYLDLADTAFLTERDYSISLKDTAKAGDIVLSMSGTIGMTAVIEESVQKCSINQRILKFTPKNIDKDFLALLLNSVVGRYQLERIGTGGVQTNISFNDIKNILIPRLGDIKEQKIADLVRKSHAARKTSKELLEDAKRELEEMIEKR